ncbi:MAG: aquaporin [Capsulimonadales bacterium]|nr:aquaporin [Capsulimonadales bacterium]
MIRRYLAELIGTFGIVFAPVALAAVSARPGGEGSLALAAFVSGLAVLGMIYALGHISAAHFNPAVTLGFAATGRFPWRYVPAYMIAQFLGGILATVVVALLFGNGAWGVHRPAPYLTPIQAVGAECVLTFLLMLVIISVATDKRANGAIPGLSIGLTVVFLVMIGGTATGGSMNPARSFAPALLAGGSSLASWWIYLVGPSLGAVLAARLYEALRGGNEHAQGAPNDLAVALERTLSH